MAHDTEFHVHHDSPEAIGRRERLGVRLLIVADGAFLFGMIFSYFYLRNLNVNGGWLQREFILSALLPDGSPHSG